MHQTAPKTVLGITMLQLYGVTKNVGKLKLNIGYSYENEGFTNNISVALTLKRVIFPVITIIKQS